MTNFSERFGHTNVKTGIQLSEMDQRLRNRLWNNLKLTLLLSDERTFYKDSKLQIFFLNLWHNFFGDTLEIMDKEIYHNVDKLSNWYGSARWYEIYDFLEFCADLKNAKNSSKGWTFIKNSSQIFIRKSNLILEQERSGYRFIGTKIVPITDEIEMAEIEIAASGSPQSGAGEHINSAVRLYSNRDAPDYRNSIKESISAVESAISTLNGVKSRSLGSGPIDFRGVS